MEHKYHGRSIVRLEDQLAYEMIIELQNIQLMLVQILKAMNPTITPTSTEIKEVKNNNVSKHTKPIYQKSNTNI
jgi:hypothetical protein